VFEWLSVLISLKCGFALAISLVFVYVGDLAIGIYLAKQLESGSDIMAGVKPQVIQKQHRDEESKLDVR
jgi:hypothetical protein